MDKSFKKNNIKLWMVIILSFVPGLSLLYLGRWKKSIPLFVIDTGILLTFIFTDSYLAKLLAINIYFFSFIVPFIESYQLAKYGVNTIDTDSRWYITVLLLTTGFNALPLLWRSVKFSQKAKVIWSASVPILAGVFVVFLVKYWNQAETALRDIITG